ncbi:MAG: hypothetical protein RIR18_2257 [Pseudomonadota bacterium]|jgi:type II secretory pathway pseudopilin PulG
MKNKDEKQPPGCFFYGSHKQSGFSLLTIMLMAVALASGLAYFVVNAGLNVQGQMNNIRTNQLVAQAQFIAQRIAKCATDYPDGNNGTGFHIPYPAGSTTVNVPTLTCPKTTQNLWSGVDGVYLLQPPEGFGAWSYINDGTGVKISITANDPTAYATPISSAATRIGTQASSTSDTLSMFILQP